MGMNHGPEIRVIGATYLNTIASEQVFGINLRPSASLFDSGRFFPDYDSRYSWNIKCFRYLLSLRILPSIGSLDLLLVLGREIEA